MNDFSVIWSGADGEYIGLCAAFPSLIWCASTHDEALAGIRQLVQDIREEPNDDPTRVYSAAWWEANGMAPASITRKKTARENSA